MAKRTPLDLVRKRQRAGQVVRTEPGGYTVPRHYFDGGFFDPTIRLPKPTMPVGFNPLEPLPQPQPQGPGGPSFGCGGTSVVELTCSTIFPSCGPEYALCVAGGSLIPGLTPQEPEGTPGPGNQAETCPQGYKRIPATNQCVAVSEIGPGGAPFITGTGWEAVQGSFGMPALTPLPEQRTHLTCPGGMVLGKDNLCYPRSTPGLGRRGSFRKWKGSRRPKVSAADWKALQRAERTREKIKDVAKTAGFTVRKRGR